MGMVPALIILFFSALFLVWQGTLALEAGFVIMAVSLSAIIWKRVRGLQTRRRIRAEVKERKAKWGGVLTVVSGLSSLIGLPCHLFVTRADELVLEDMAGVRIIPLSDIQKIGLFTGKTLERMSDQQLMKALGLQSLPHFSYVRAWVARNPRARKRQLMAIRFEKPLNDLEYSEMAVFSDLDELGNLRAFALRPEIAVKTALASPRSVKKRKKGPRVSLAPSKAEEKGRGEDPVAKVLPWEIDHRPAERSLPPDTAEIAAPGRDRPRDSR